MDFEMAIQKQIRKAQDEHLKLIRLFVDWKEQIKKESQLNNKTKQRIWKKVKKST